MLGVIDAHVILTALALGAVTLLVIGAACVIGLRVSGHWRAVLEAERAEAERTARRQAEAAVRQRVVIEYRAAECAREKALRNRQARRQYEAIMRQARMELLRQDLHLRRTAP